MTLPAYLVHILMTNMSTLEAQELETAMVAASAPHMERRARARLLGRLRQASGPGAGETRSHVEYKPVKPEDAEAARAWFEQQGVRVETKGCG